MVKYERHPAPEKLLRQMTIETVNLLALGGPDRVQEAALPEAGVRLIAKAWNLPREDLDGSLELIAAQGEKARAPVPDAPQKASGAAAPKKASKARTDKGAR